MFFNQVSTIKLIAHNVKIISNIYYLLQAHNDFNKNFVEFVYRI